VALIEYANGVRATFHTNCNAGIPERRMYILGTHGAVRADVLTGEIQYEKKSVFDETIRNIRTGASGGHGDGDTYLTRHMARVFRGQETPQTTIDDGLLSAVTCFGIDQAQETAKVVDCRPLWKRAGITR